MNAYIVEALRSPRGAAREDGALRGVKPVALLAQVLNALRDRAGLDATQLSDLVVGCATQTGEQGANIGKTAALYAGWDARVPAMTINRFCASGLSAVNYAAAQLMQADALAVAGGVEMMSRVPMFADNGAFFADPEVVDRTAFVHPGLGADLVATQHGISREDCDGYAALSQTRAADARRAGRFARSLVPILLPDGSTALAQDETIREGTTPEKLASRPPAFAELGAKGGDARLMKLFPDLKAIDHVHHAGNSPGMADGAAAVLLGTEAAVRRAGMRARARILGCAEACTAVTQTGAVEATRTALARAGVRIEDVDLFEVRDSFAAVTLHYVRALGVPMDRFNVNGSSIALGHPLGATGAMLVGTLLDELERRSARLGVVAIAGAAGVATATVIEKIN